jgi:hypothetical protein
MKTASVRFTATLALFAPLAFADFRYEQNVRPSGATLAAMMNAPRTPNKAAVDGVSATLAFKENRMFANIGGKVGQIVDLDKETLTLINFEKRVYSVTTFAEEKAKKAQPAGPKPSITVKETGKTDVIDGLKVRELMIAITMTLDDPLTGMKGSIHTESSAWLGPELPGSEAMRAFQKRFGGLMGAGAGLPSAGMNSGMDSGQLEAAIQMAATNSVPVLQIMRIVSSDLPAYKLLESIIAKAPPVAPTGRQGSFSTETALMEMTTKMSKFSNAPLEDSLFEVPAGFTQVKNAMQR